MPDEPDKPGGKTEAERALEDEENERPTVSPPFDPIAFARDLLKPSTAPNAEDLSADAHTRVTPPRGVDQQAAAASRPSRKKTPTSTISLANARIPSELPSARPTTKPEPRRSGVKEHDPWASLELETRPPPANGPFEDSRAAIAEHRPPDLNLDEVGDDSDVGSFGAPAKSRDREMNDRVELGDYSGALEIAEEILRGAPENIGAKAVAETCRTVLRQIYAARIGPLDRVPVVMVARDQLRWLSIDHKAGFVLSLVDGVSSVEMIIDVSGMPELDTLRILSELAQQRVIALR